MKIQWRGVTPGGDSISGAIPVDSYPSGDPLVKFGQAWCRIDRIMLRPTSMFDLMGGLFFVDALLERGFREPELFLPFVPGARQDRLSQDPAADFLFTAKSIAREINMRRFSQVHVVDPHSDVISGLIDRCHVISASECLQLRDHGGSRSWDAVISPDAGAEKRASAVAKALELPLIHGWKTRDVRTGAIAGFGLENPTIAGNRVLVVDDICDGGGTFVGLGSVLKERGLSADLYVTHGLFTRGLAPLLVHYDHVYCTDSVEPDRVGLKHRSVTVIHVCERLFGGTFQ